MSIVLDRVTLAHIVGADVETRNRFIGMLLKGDPIIELVERGDPRLTSPFNILEVSLMYPAEFSSNKYVSISQSEIEALDTLLTSAYDHSTAGNIMQAFYNRVSG